MPRLAEEARLASCVEAHKRLNFLALKNGDAPLKVEGKAELTGTVLFAFDLNYAGVFRLTNIPQENVGPLLMIECPRLLFPFARELIASAISNGGFPPLMLQPIDSINALAWGARRAGERWAGKDLIFFVLPRPAPHAGVEQPPTVSYAIRFILDRQGRSL